jgi:predicted nucleic acid-binding protein
MAGADARKAAAAAIATTVVVFMEILLSVVRLWWRTERRWKPLTSVLVSKKTECKDSKA